MMSNHLNSTEEKKQKHKPQDECERKDGNLEFPWVV